MREEDEENGSCGGVLRAFVLPMGLDAGPTPPGLCRAGSGVCRRDLRPDLSQEFEGGVSIFLVMGELGSPR